MPDESRKKVGYGNVNRKGGDREGMRDRERATEGVLADAEHRAEHPEDYPGPGPMEARWARDQLNRGPADDYVGHNRKFEHIPDGGIGEPPEGTVRPERRGRKGAS